MAAVDIDLTNTSTALVVVDMQNGYLHEKGAFARLWPEANNREVKPVDPAKDFAAASRQFDLALLRQAIPHCKRLIEAARRAGVPVIFVKYVYRKDYKDGGVLIRKVNPAFRDVGYVAEGTWDAEIIDELTPQPGDFIVNKARFSAFYATTLETVLRSLNVETLVVCGVTAHVCVESTARDGHMRDYQVVIASDASGEVNEIWKQTALASFSLAFGWVLPVDDIVAAWEVPRLSENVRQAASV